MEKLNKIDRVTCQSAKSDSNIFIVHSLTTKMGDKVLKESSIIFISN